MRKLSWPIWAIDNSTYVLIVLITVLLPDNGHPTDIPSKSIRSFPLSCLSL